MLVPISHVDNKAPVVTFSADSTNESTTGTPSFSWTSDERASFQCAIKGVTAFEDCGTGTSGTWSKSNVPDGKRTFLVRARDEFGNQNEPYSFPFDVGRSRCQHHCALLLGELGKMQDNGRP